MTRALQAIAGSGLYAAIAWLTSYMQLGGTYDISLRPGIVIPIVFGLRFGPLVGFVTGALGNTLGDFLTSGTTYWNWSLGNGLIGLVAGAYAWHTYAGWKHYAWAIGAGCIGIAVGLAVASGLDVWICRSTASAPPNSCSVIPMTFADALNQEFLPALKSDLVNALILLPVLLYNLQNLDMRAWNWLTSGLLRKLMLAMMISAALPTVLLGWFLMQTNTTLGAQVAFTVIVTALFAVVNATLAAQHFSKPLMRLTSAARQMVDAQLSSGQAQVLAETHGDDEIAELSRVFGQMAGEVMHREQELHQQVEVLSIQIDEAKRRTEVAEITESEYFQELAQKSKEARARRRSA